MDTKLNINRLAPLDQTITPMTSVCVWTCGGNIIVRGGDPIIIPTLDQLHSDEDDLIQGITELQVAIGAFIETGKCSEVLASKSTNIRDWLMDLVHMYRKLDLIHSMLDCWEVVNNEKITEDRLRTMVEDYNKLNAPIGTNDLFKQLRHIVEINLNEVDDGTAN